MGVEIGDSVNGFNFMGGNYLKPEIRTKNDNAKVIWRKLTARKSGKKLAKFGSLLAKGISKDEARFVFPSNNSLVLNKVKSLIPNIVKGLLWEHWNESFCKIKENGYFADNCDNTKESGMRLEVMLNPIAGGNKLGGMEWTGVFVNPVGSVFIGANGGRIVPIKTVKLLEMRRPDKDKDSFVVEVYNEHGVAFVLALADKLGVKWTLK